MRDNYDFSDAVKNPFAGRIKGKYTVTIYYDFTENSEVQNDIKNDATYSDEVKLSEKYHRVNVPNDK